jgi:predicted aminopeptidase
MPRSSRSSSPVAPAANASAAAQSAAARSAERTSIRTKLALPALVVASLATSGCYLSHLAEGQLRLLRARQPIDALIEAPDTPPALRQRLERVGEARAYAERIGLDVGGQYTSYAAWPGDRVVTAVVAARQGEVEPAGFWFPGLGTLPYKGFFDLARAEAEADRLRGNGLDVCLVPVPAYSTLGWFDDPVTEPMLQPGEGWLVETLLHELVHATAYLGDDPDWSEGVATFVGEEASVRFYQDAQDAPGAARRRREVDEGRRVDAEILALRGRVAELYAALPGGPEREAQRETLEREARAAIAALPLATRDAARLAADLRLNDACLALAATYTALLPEFAQALDALGGDVAAFVARLRAAADADEPKRALLGEP